MVLLAPPHEALRASALHAGPRTKSSTQDTFVGLCAQLRSMDHGENLEAMVATGGCKSLMLLQNMCSVENQKGSYWVDGGKTYHQICY